LPQVEEFLEKEKKEFQNNKEDSMDIKFFENYKYHY
jgi:hypothetical protein